MSPAFDPLSFTRDIEQAAEVGGWTIRCLSPCDASGRIWLQRAAKIGDSAPRIYISAGIHGDEFSGPYAILEMLRQPDFFASVNATLFPILNPDGLTRGIRENATGIDLNRDYRNSKSVEIQGHIDILKTLGRFDAALMLHEDYEGIGAYLYELNDTLRPSLGADIIAAMGQHVPIDLRPEIEEVPAKGGVLSRRDLLARLGTFEDRPDWPEAIYLTVNHTTVCYTTETPKPFPLEDRIQAQIAAVQTVIGALHEPPTVNNALVPAPKLEEDCYDWWKRHEEQLVIRDRIRPQIVLIGDSITHFWGGEPQAEQRNGPLAWEETFGDLPVLNLGFGWDRTQNVLWRLDHGEFDGLAPKHVVIHIGTNNTTGTPNARENTAPEIVAGILAVADKIRAKSPDSRLIVMAIFPRGEKPTDPFRAKIAAINSLLAPALQSRPGITYLDIGARFLQPDGILPKEIMPDEIHPGEAGYRIWGQALLEAGIRK